MQFLGKGPLFNTFVCWLLRDCSPLETTFLDHTAVSQSGDSHFMAETRKTTLETKVTLKSKFKCRATGFALNFFIMLDWTGTDYLLRLRSLHRILKIPFALSFVGCLSHLIFKQPIQY